MSEYKILPVINSPADIKKLPKNQLEPLCTELRQYIIEQTANNPGHLGASLGTIELTVAIHYVFDTPTDKLVWDVGHQAYAHKILTGRREAFENNRKLNGISGFPKMTESPYDAFGGGHASISISSILGMAVAADLSGNKTRNHIAVIGDGALTGGEAFEGLNHAGNAKANVLVILNDNGMAIDKNVGAMSKYLVKLSTSTTYNRFKTKIWNLLSGKGLKARSVMQNTQNMVKGSLLKESNLFESLGFRYFGPVDGHNILYLVDVLSRLKNLKGPKLLHCITMKGKGLKKAEESQTLYHAPGLFDPVSGNILQPEFDPYKIEKYQKVFGTTIIDLAEQNEKIVGITPAMASGCSLDMMMQCFPNRCFDVGIAEQHAVTFSAGLATDGYIPFCNIYSSFLQRSYDQIIHDVALQNLHVVFCIDRAGLVGEDGATHHGVFDLAYLRCIPNMIVSAPMNEMDLRNLMYTATQTKSPFSIRYPRGKGVLQQWKNEPFSLLPIGKGIEVKKGQKIAVLGIGHITNNVVKADKILQQEGFDIGIYNMIFLKPIDESLLDFVCQNYEQIVTIENGVKTGGLGGVVAEYMKQHNYNNPLTILGIDDVFVEQGSVAQLQSLCKLDVDSIVKTIKEL